MDAVNPNAPALPCGEHYVVRDDIRGYETTHKKGALHYGLSIRAELAARAMQGMCANHDYFSCASAGQIASEAVAHADALIAELNKELEVAK